MKKVINCTVISNFSAIGRLDLLHHTVDALHLPTDVYDEIRAGQMAGYKFYDNIEQYITPFSPNGWLHLVTMTEEELQRSTSLPAHLHQGERACLCIARQRGWAFLSDDRAAREQANDWNISLSGTLGVLLLAIQDGRLTIDTGNILLNEMINQANYRSPTTDLNTLLVP
jgi:predicted nucleic acid-binding protein